MVVLYTTAFPDTSLNTPLPPTHLVVDSRWGLPVIEGNKNLSYFLFPPSVIFVLVSSWTIFFVAYFYLYFLFLSIFDIF